MIDSKGWLIVLVGPEYDSVGIEIENEQIRDIESWGIASCGFGGGNNGYVLVISFHMMNSYR